MWYVRLCIHNLKDINQLFAFSNTSLCSKTCIITFRVVFSSNILIIIIILFIYIASGLCDVICWNNGTHTLECPDGSYCCYNDKCWSVFIVLKHSLKNMYGLVNISIYALVSAVHFQPIKDARDWKHIGLLICEESLLIAEERLFINK